MTSEFKSDFSVSTSILFSVSALCLLGGIIRNLETAILIEQKMDTLMIKGIQIRMCPRDGRFSISGTV